MKINRRRYILTSSAVIGSLALSGCSGDDPSDTAEGNPESNNGGSEGGNSGNEQSEVEILEHSFYEEQFTSGVIGTARNNTDNELNYVEVNAVFLDGEGTQIGEGLDNVSELAAGRTWEFDCMFLGENSGRIEQYEIEASTGF